MTTIDLRLCKPGDKLEMRNGEVAKYVNSNGCSMYPHSAKMPNGTTAYFTDNGRFYSDRTSSTDIVKVIQMPTDSTIPQRGTKEFARYAAETMMAGAAGQAIEFLNLNSANRLFSEVFGQTAWNWAQYDYRIKPKPPVIQWTRDTCPVGAVVKRKVSGDRSTIECASTCLVVLGGVMAAITYDGLLSNFTMDNGEPCGTVKK